MGIFIKVELSERERRFVRATLVVATGLVLGGIGLASAAPIDTTWIKPGDPIPAASLKANLDGLQQQLNKPTISKNGKQYSLGATYCGKTATSTNGQITNGYAGAKVLCEAVAACGNSPSAHMCTTEEVNRSAQMGITVDSGWYSATEHSTWFGCSNFQCASSQNVTDCDGWSVTYGDYYAMAWQAGGYPRQAACNTSRPVLCCD